MDEKFVGLKSSFEDRPKKASGLVYVFLGGVFALVFLFGTFLAFEGYHIAFSIQQIQEDIEEIRTVLNDWELTE